MTDLEVFPSLISRIHIAWESLPVSDAQGGKICRWWC